jgi:hypothetical protein
MRITLIRAALLLILSIGTAAAQQGNAPAATPRPGPPILRLTAPGFGDGGPIAKQNTCQGAGVSPELHWSNAPKGVARFVVIMHGTDNHPAKGMADEMFGFSGTCRQARHNSPKDWPQIHKCRTAACKPRGVAISSVTARLVLLPGAGPIITSSNSTQWTRNSISLRKRHAMTS